MISDDIAHADRGVNSVVSPSRLAQLGDYASGEARRTKMAGWRVTQFLHHDSCMEKCQLTDDEKRALNVSVSECARTAASVSSMH